MKYILLLALSIGLAACEIDEQFDPNRPGIGSVAENASLAELNLLATGIEAGMRNGYANYVTASGTIARELYLFDADPRNTEDLLGKEDRTLDANTFYLTAPYSSRYQVIKTVNTLLDALDNTESVTEDEKEGYRGFANTIKAYMLSQVLDLLGTNGIRVEVSNPEDLGPFLSEEASYDAVLTLFDQAHDQLMGSSFAFMPSTGFSNPDNPDDDFTTPERFALVNRALAARVATHAARYQQALDYANASFLDLSGNIEIGPEHVFSLNPGDLTNPIFRPPGQNGDQIIVHPRIIDNATEGDRRLSKFALRDNPTSQDGLSGDYESALYASNISPIDIIRNEELLLIYAEANINLGNLDEGVRALNVIRTAAGIGAYDGPVTQEALIDEMLYQRCYSLWGEGHRMFDLRRYDRLNADFLPIDRPGDDVFTQFPIPLAEGV